jgi:hypothetical protein
MTVEGISTFMGVALDFEVFRVLQLTIAATIRYSVMVVSELVIL